MKGMHRAALCGVALWSVSAVAGAPAGPSPSALVPHPLVVVGGGEEDAARFGPQLDAELAHREVRVVGQTCARQFVARRPGGTCGGEESCLAELARTCGGQRALYVTVYPYRPQMVFGGKVVRADGLLERSASNLAVGRPKGRLRPEMIRPGIETVLTRGLHLETLDLETAGASSAATSAPAVGDRPGAPSPTETPPPSVVTAPASKGESAQRIAGYACLGVGVVTLGVGIALLFSANKDEDAYRKTLDPDGQRPPTPEAQAAQASLRSKGAPVTIALVAGGALIAAGITLWALDVKAPERTHVDVRASAGGGSVVLAGKF